MAIAVDTKTVVHWELPSAARCPGGRQRPSLFARIGRLECNELTCVFKVRLTRHVFLLETGNVFACSTCSRCLDWISPAGFDAVNGNRSFPCSKISKMLRLARDQCGSAILPRRLNSCAEQKRLSTSVAIRPGTERQHALRL